MHCSNRQFGGTAGAGEAEQQVSIAQAEVSFEDASRLDYDRRRRERIAKAGHRIDAAAADDTFVRLLVNVVNKVVCLNPVSHYHQSHQKLSLRFKPYQSHLAVSPILTRRCCQDVLH